MTGLDYVSGFAIDGDRLWWTTVSGDLLSAPKAGGPTSDPIHVSGGGGFADSIAFDESAIYVSAATDGLFRVDRVTSTVTRLDTGYIAAVATSGLDGNVVWSVFGAWGTTAPAAVGIKRLELGESSPEVLTTDGSVVIAVDAAGPTASAFPVIPARAPNFRSVHVTTTAPSTRSQASLRRSEALRQMEHPSSSRTRVRRR